MFTICLPDSLNLSPIKRRLLLVALCLLLYLPGLNTLPVMDRDEARYVQATKQMLETGQFHDIRFQDAPRYQKPIGIYWLQSASVTLLGQSLDVVWPYRLVSLVAMILAVLLLECFATALFSPQIGFTAAVFLASSVLPAIEAHLAKTDATLLLAVMMSMVGMGTLLLDKPLLGRASISFCLLWLGLALGLLIKGPMILLIVGLSLLAWCVANKSWHDVFKLKPVYGILFLLLLTVPWVVMLHVQSHGQFWEASLGGDVLSKLSGGQESHGAPPGFYLLTSLITLFPASLFILPVLKYVLADTKDWRQPALLFCLCWALPSWLFFELAPTKLVHYILPLFPPLAMLIASALWQTRMVSSRFFKSFASVLLVLFTLALLAALVCAPMLLMQSLTLVEAIVSSLPFIILLLVLAVVLLLIILKHHWQRHNAAVIWPPLAYGVLLMLLLSCFAPRLPSLWVSNAIQEHLVSVEKLSFPQDASRVILVGYNEPSVVFKLGTRVQLKDPEAAIQLIRNTQSSWVLLLEDAAFGHVKKGLALRGVHLDGRVRRIHGFNYSKGRWVTLHVYRFNEAH